MIITAKWLYENCCESNDAIFHYKMDIEQLTKTQLILVALLVSFVTSIATGIATASLLEQAPPEVTRVIDRVVERTVETVTQTEGNVTEKTVVIREDDLISDSISSITKSLVRVYTSDGQTFLGVGFVVSSEGDVITSASPIENNNTYSVRLNDGTLANFKVVKEDAEQGLALLGLVDSSLDVELTPVVFSDVGVVKLGQSIISVSGEQNDVATGIISKINYTSSSEDAEPVVSSLQANIASASAIIGTPIINLFGDVVGVKISLNSTSFLPASAVESFLNTGQ